MISDGKAVLEEWTVVMVALTCPRDDEALHVRLRPTPAATPLLLNLLCGRGKICQRAWSWSSLKDIEEDERTNPRKNNLCTIERLRSTIPALVHAS